MADEKKPVMLKTKVVMQCTNCQRIIAVGETVTTPGEDEMNRGAVVCFDCTNPPKVEAPAKAETSAKAKQV